MHYANTNIITCIAAVQLVKACACTFFEFSTTCLDAPFPPRAQRRISVCVCVCVRKRGERSLAFMFIKLESSSLSLSTATKSSPDATRNFDASRAARECRTLQQIFGPESEHTFCAQVSKCEWVIAHAYTNSCGCVCWGVFECGNVCGCVCVCNIN